MKDELRPSKLQHWWDRPGYWAESWRSEETCSHSETSQRLLTVVEKLAGSGIIIRDEMINHIICECSKFAQKGYKTRHDWVGKVIHWELCMKLKFDHTNKQYMHNLESLQENETHKVLRDFEIQTDRLMSARRPDLIIINN